MRKNQISQGTRLPSRNNMNGPKLPPEARVWSYLVLGSGVLGAVIFLNVGDVIKAAVVFLVAAAIAIAVIAVCKYIEWLLK